MSHKNRLIQGVSWNLFFLMLSVPVGYTTKMILANSLSKMEVGLFYTIFDLICMAIIFRSFGFISSIVYYIPKFKVQNRMDLIKSSMIITLLVILSSTIITAKILYSILPPIIVNYIPNLTSFTNLETVSQILLIMLVGYYIFGGLSEYVSNIIRGFQHQKLYSTYSFFLSFLIMIGTYILIHAGCGIYAPVVAYSIAPILMVLIYGTIFFSKIFPEIFTIKAKYSKNLFKDLLSYSLPVMIGGAGYLIMGYLDTFCLAYFTGLEAIADYKNIAMPSVMAISYIASSMCIVFMPITTELWEKKELKTLSLALEKLITYSFITTIPLSILLTYFSKIVILTLFNESYLSATTPMIILGLGVIFLSINGLMFAVLNGIGKPNLSTKILYFGAGINLLFNLLLIPKYGVVGAAITTSFSYIAIQLIQIKCLKKYIAYNFPLKQFLLCITYGIMSICPIYIIQKYLPNNIWSAMVLGIVYLLIYGGLTIKSKIVRYEELL